MEDDYRALCVTCELEPNIKNNFHMKIQGSEAKVYEGEFLKKDAILKERFQKKYRHPDLDKALTTERMKAEVRALNKCFDIGIKCPAIYFVDLQTGCIVLEKIPNAVTVKEILAFRHRVHGAEGLSRILPLASKIGETLAKMHKNDLVHGDLTTSNMIVREEELPKITGDGSSQDYDLFLIDFGLSKRDVVPEDKAVDLYVLERAIASSHPEYDGFFDSIIEAYSKAGQGKNGPVLKKLEEVRARGRKRTMVG